MLAEVAAPGRAVGRQARLAQLLLVPLGIGAGREEQDDLARARRAAVDELLAPAARRAAPRLAASGGPVPEYAALSVTSSSTGVPNTGSGKSPDAASGWNSSPNSAPKRWLTTASTSGRER